MYQRYSIVLAVGAFILDNKKKLLIVKKSSYEKVDPGLWTIPGGKVNIKEHIIDALKREVLEEVGIKINNFQWIGENVFENNHFYFHAQHFLCKTKSIRVKLEKSLLEYKWINKSEINNYEFHPNIKKRIKIIYDL